MPAARAFTELQFWQRARAWSRDIFQLTRHAPFARDQRLVVQINDFSESVMANMAEGFAPRHAGRIHHVSRLRDRQPR
jgi:four helix bundle protein